MKEYHQRALANIGLDVLRMKEYRIELTSALKCLRLAYGVYEYELTHRDDVHLQTIQKLLADDKRIRTRTLRDGGQAVTLSTSAEDKEKCKWLSLRDDMIAYFVQRIEDRCFDHPCVNLSPHSIRDGGPQSTNSTLSCSSSSSATLPSTRCARSGRGLIRTSLSLASRSCKHISSICRRRLSRYSTSPTSAKW